jgi:hypothetical protein
MTAEVRLQGERIEIHSPKFQLLRFNDLRPISEPDYLIKGLVPAQGLSLIWGRPKCGKTFWAFDATMHVALGWPYRGRKVKSGPVVYCAFEGINGYRKRAEAFRIRKLAGDAHDVSFFLFGGSLKLVRDHDALIKSIRVQVHPDNPVAIVLDTLNRSLEGSESSDADMGAYIKAADAIRDAFGCAVLIVHHCGHEDSRPRGHSSLTAAVDAQLAVKRDDMDNVIVQLEFMRDGPEDQVVVSRLEAVEIGTDADGDEMTSFVVVEAEAQPVGHKPKVSSGGAAANIALLALAKAIDEVGQIDESSEHIPAGMRAVSLDVFRQYAYSMGISGSIQDRAKQLAFQRCLQKLVASGEVGIWQHQVWILRDHDR